LVGGIAGDVVAVIMENCFNYLDAPVVRCASLDTPVPFSIPLEQNFLAKSRFEKQLVELWEY
jgi:2-oxoisovalerate dehydrogenase E1 component